MPPGWDVSRETPVLPVSKIKTSHGGPEDTIAGGWLKRLGVRVWRWMPGWTRGALTWWLNAHFVVGAVAIIDDGDSGIPPFPVGSAMVPNPAGRTAQP